VPTSDAEIERVRELVAAIPPGRAVGWIMRTDSADLPWHRVLRADGTPAPQLAHRQLRQLAEEGCPIRGDRVDLVAARFRFETRGGPL
jgi:alkylated DNA nucleotide flippase Atl1